MIRPLPRRARRPGPIAIAPGALALCALVLLVSPARSAAAIPGVADSTLAVFDGGVIQPSDFIRPWQALAPSERPPGDPVRSRTSFLESIVDRHLIAAQARQRPFVLSPAESAALERTRRALIQNELFHVLTADFQKPTAEQLAIYRRQRADLAEIRFITFNDPASANSWRLRLGSGTPVSALDDRIARGGPGAPQADAFRMVAADQIPDTLAQVIWAMRPGQLSEVHSFAGHPVLIHVRSFAPRPDALPLSDAKDDEADYIRRQGNLVRERVRADLARRCGRVFVDEGMNVLLAGYQKVPPRQDVDSTSGMPIVRATLPMPTFTAADTGLIVARTSHGELNLVSYLRYWGRVPALARPDVRDRVGLEGAVDRVALEDELVVMGIERGMDRSPAVMEELARQREGFALDRYYAEAIQAKVRVPEAALRRYFASRPGHYDDVATVEARIILLDRQALADSLLALARGGRSFGELARTHSLDGQTAADDGKTGVIRRRTNPNVGLEDAMFATPAGALGGPERTPEGWVIWRIESSFPGKKRSLEEAREWVERDYRTVEEEKLLEKLLVKLRKQAHVRIFRERVTPDLGAGGPWDE